MFLVFAAAVVIVASAVGLLSVSRTWWMLAVLFSIHRAAQPRENPPDGRPRRPDRRGVRLIPRAARHPRPLARSLL